MLNAAVLHAACDNPALAPWLDRGIPVYALAEDLMLHGVDRIAEGVTLVDYPAWVALTTGYQRQQLWA